ncbi:MAG: NYN domain-containing protein [Calditrichota bacterium]
MNRIAILIDGNNFYKGCQLNFNRTDVDFRRLGLKLCKAIDGEMLRIYYYNAHVSKSIDPLGFQRQQKFFDNLRATPFITLKLGHLVYHRIRTDHGISSQYFPTEKGIDVQIAVDMIRLGLLKACEGIILTSGDSDYIYAVRFAKDLGCNVYIASFPMGGSLELRNEGDGSCVMDQEFMDECFIRTMPYARREPGYYPRHDYQQPYGRRFDVEPDIIDEEIIGGVNTRSYEEEVDLTSKPYPEEGDIDKPSDTPPKEDNFEG